MLWALMALCAKKLSLKRRDALIPMFSVLVQQQGDVAELFASSGTMTRPSTATTRPKTWSVATTLHTIIIVV